MHPRSTQQLCVVLVAIAPLLHAGALPPAVHAHGDIHARIAQLTARIEEQPREAELYVARGLLHTLHREWAQAIRDYVRARKLDPHRTDIDYLLAKALLEQGQLRRARARILVHLRSAPRDADALVVKARILARLGRRVHAAQALDDAIAQLPHPSPRHFIERARLWVKSDRTRALHGLRDAVRRLGPIASVVELGHNISVEYADHRGALEWIELLPADLRNSPLWLMRTGDAAAHCGKAEQAKRNWILAHDTLQALKPARKQAPAMRRIAAELDERLARK